MKDFSLIETMRFTPGEGITRLDLHLARLVQSAAVLGFAGGQGAKAALNDALASLEPGEGSLRVRLELFHEGEISITTAPFTLQVPETVWHVAAAKASIRSDDPLTRHKTTRRAIYETARAEVDVKQAQEVLLLNDRNMLCEGTITNVFVEDSEGRLLTPPLSSGCLAGVLRAELLASGRACEADLHLDALRSRRFYVGNSLRGLIRAELIEE